MRPPGMPHGEHGHHGHWAGGRVPKGNVRGLLLAALLDGPAHGYELMGRLEGQAGGRWRPSPGSVYPLLQVLEDEGLVRGRDSGGRKVYELTEQGRTLADAGQLPSRRTWTCAPRCTGCTPPPSRWQRRETPPRCRRQWRLSGTPARRSTGCSRSSAGGHTRGRGNYVTETPTARPQRRRKPPRPVEVVSVSKITPRLVSVLVRGDALAEFRIEAPT